MVRFVSQLLEQIKDAESTWDGSKLMNNVGLGRLVSDLEALVASCKVSELRWLVNFHRRFTLALVAMGALGFVIIGLGISFFCASRRPMTRPSTWPGGSCRERARSDGLWEAMGG
jgi:hypothetical protein